MKMIIGDLSTFVACFDYKKEFLHLGVLFDRVTACGNPIDGDILLSREVEITCPECIAEIEYRQAHPDCRKRFGVVVHKGGRYAG